jgi:hypothetical protein
MAKYIINLWVTEARLKTIKVDAANSSEAEAIAEKAIEDTQSNGGDENWGMEECSFDYQVWKSGDEE